MSTSFYTNLLVNFKLPNRQIEQTGRANIHQSGDALLYGGSLAVLLNNSYRIYTCRLASSLMVTAKTITHYIDLLSDLLLVRRLSPFHANIGKRLVKSPKVYVRDSGLVHALLDIGDYNMLAGHPIRGMSWEGFVIENLINVAPYRTLPSFYRTSAGAEIDLILEFPNGHIWAIEIKSSLTGKPSKGFYHAIEDIKPDKCFVVCAGEDSYPISEGIDAISISEMAQEIYHMKKDY
jgi:predicted AAA+ superfamily ATPase